MNKASRYVLAALVAVTAIAAAVGVAANNRATHSSTSGVSDVIVQGGTTITDSGLMQSVIEPGFARAYPQFKLTYVPVATAQAIVNAEAGQADAVLTHSPAAESAFVSSGYSYEPGGRLVMTSDFVIVGSTTDAAHVAAGPTHDVVRAFCEIAAAGARGDAEFISRGDKSGTNAKELEIWALAASPAGCPSIVSLNDHGEPGTAQTSTTAAWYRTTGLGQGANLAVTDQCNFRSANCYTLADRGTFAQHQHAGSLSALAIVSSLNSGRSALGGAGLLLNPYHAYAVNPAKEPGVHINLAGALAFLNFLTRPATQAAIASYPTSADPAFTPDAFPRISMTSDLPMSVTHGTLVTLTGTDTPGNALDPSNAGAVVRLYRTQAPGVTVASATVSATGRFSLRFAATAPGSYELYVPQHPDGLIFPGNTGFRQALTVALGRLAVVS